MFGNRNILNRKAMQRVLPRRQHPGRVQENAKQPTRTSAVKYRTIPKWKP